MHSLRRCGPHLFRKQTTIPRLSNSLLPRHGQKYRNITTVTDAQNPPRSLPKLNGWLYVIPTTVLVVGGAGVLAYNYNQPFRHTALAVVRCSRIAGEFEIFESMRELA